MDIVFCQTEYHYNGRGEDCCLQGDHSRSYEDFWALVKVSEFAVTPLSEMDLSLDVTYIICPPNGELRSRVAQAREAVMGNQTARVVAWDLEMHHRPMEDTHKRRETLFPYVDEVWVSDPSYRDALRHKYVEASKSYEKLEDIDRKLRFVVMGSDERLSQGATPEPEVYDFIHLSYIHARRTRILGTLVKDPKYHVAPNAWGLDRHIRLLTSKVMLNVHQFPVQNFEVLRFSLAAAYKIPVISEPILAPGPLMAGLDYREADEANLQKSLDDLLQDAARREILGLALHERLCREYKFEDQVRKAASELSCLQV